MKAIVLALLWCALSAASAAADGQEPPVLVVASGGEVRLEPPEDGARVEAAFDGGALRPISGSIAAPEEGDHWLALASRDRAGNLSPIRWVRVRVDAAAPRIELDTRPAAADGGGGRRWLPPGAEVTARASDDLAGVARLALAAGDEAAEVEGSEVTVPLPAGGEVTVRAHAIDRVGNRTDEASPGDASLTLWIDELPPAGEIRVAGPHVPGDGGSLEGAVLSPSARLTAEIADGESGLADWTPRSDGAEVDPEAWIGPWTPGPHTVEAVATDRVGNVGRVGPFRLLVDGAGPEIAWRVLTAGSGAPDRVGDDGETWYRPPVEVAAEARDEVAGLAELRWSLDGETFEVADGPMAVDGDRLQLAATDRVGNRSEVEARWRLDLEPPEVRVATPGGGGVPAGGVLTVTRGEALEVEAVDRGAGIERATYVMNRGWPVPPPARPLPERIVCRRAGRFELTIEAVDRLGNTFRGVWQVAVRRSGG